MFQLTSFNTVPFWLQLPSLVTLLLLLLLLMMMMMLLDSIIVLMPAVNFHWRWHSPFSLRREQLLTYELSCELVHPAIFS